MNLTPMMPKALHSMDEIKAEFRVTDKTVKEWIKEGAPIIRLPKSLHAEYTALANWLLEQQVHANTE